MMGWEGNGRFELRLQKTIGVIVEICISLIILLASLMT